MVFKKETMADNDFSGYNNYDGSLFICLAKSFWPWYATWVVVWLFLNILDIKIIFKENNFMVRTVPLLFYPIFILII